MDIQTGEPSIEGRYVAFIQCASRQVSGWCEPIIATWHGGKWHTYESPTAWIGPLPVVNTKTGEIADSFLMSPVEDWAKPGGKLQEFDL